MSQLIPVKYGKKEYPEDITPSIEELACHFDVCSLNPSMDYSLHTEYSYGPRKFRSDLVNKNSTLVDSSKKGVPELWKGGEWAIEFSTFLEELVGENNPPAIIEIHPPFSNYIKCLEEFSEIYSIFEIKINKIFPNTNIFIEKGYNLQAGKFYDLKRYGYGQSIRTDKREKAFPKDSAGYPSTAYSSSN